MSWSLNTGPTPPKAEPKHCNAMAAKGLRYHERVYRELRKSKLCLHIEPWLRDTRKGKLCQPDAVILFPQAKTAIVVEVKLNWAEGKDGKLLRLYLPAVRNAFSVEHVFPLMIVGNCRGLAEKRRPHKDLLKALQAALQYIPAHSTPVLLLP